jgi:REP element-mobilizing transposase RayT
MNRYWLLTWTTYGQWLPGDPRGSATRVHHRGERSRREHNVPGTPFDKELPGRFVSAKKLQKGPTVRFNGEDAECLLTQFHETARVRGWLLVAVAIMANHVHIVLGVPDDPDPAALLRDLKSYGSRRLNQCGTRSHARTWWTQSGSKRKLSDEAAVLAAVDYVRQQEHPLVVWVDPIVATWRTA